MTHTHTYIYIYILFRDRSEAEEFLKKLTKSKPNLDFQLKPYDETMDINPDLNLILYEKAYSKDGEKIVYIKSSGQTM